MNKHWEPCPRCESKKVKTVGKSVMVATLLTSGGCLIWVGVLFPPAWILAAILVFGSPLGLLVPNMNKCSDCNFSWKAGEASAYKESLAAIEDQKKVDSVEGESPILETPTTEEPVQQEVPKRHNDKIYFRVAGVTLENEKGQDIQKLLKRIAGTYKKEEELESFYGLTNKEIIEGLADVSEFEGQLLFDIVDLVPEPDNPYDKNAIKVYIKDAYDHSHHVGYVKKSDNVKLLKELDNNEINSTSVEFTGGKVKNIEYDWEKDKDYIEVDELTRGLEIMVKFENEMSN